MPTDHRAKLATIKRFDQLAELRPPQPVHPEAPADMAEPTDEMPEQAPAAAASNTSLKRRVGGFLRARRIRTHLISGIEYEMFVFIVGPLTGLIFPVTIAAGAGLLAFEAFLIYKLLRTCQAFPGKLAAAQREYAAYQEQTPTQPLTSSI